MRRYSRIPKLKNINPNVATEGVEYYRTNFYPEIPTRETDIYVETDFGDRLDLLANQFYGDVNYYWIIAAANPNVVDFGSINLTPGSRIRIPTELSSIFGSYVSLNE
jgi:hypothetical protein